MGLSTFTGHFGRSLAAAGLIACVGLGRVDAAPIAVWGFEANLGGSTVAHVTASDLNLIDLVATSEYRAFGIASSRGVAADGSTYTDGDPINNVARTTVSVGSSAYGHVWRSTTSPIRAFAFSLAIEEGYSVDLSDVTFDLGISQGSIANLRVEYSTSSDFSNPVLLGGGNGYGTGTETELGYSGGTLGMVRPTTSSNVSWNRYANDTGLSQPELLVGTLYFRIAGWGVDWNNADARTVVYLDNLTINGQVIPEPASLALLAAGGLMIAIRPRRHRGV